MSASEGSEKQNIGGALTYREYAFPGEFPLLLMQGARISERVDFVHFHNCVEIALCERGRMRWNLEGDVREVLPGDFLFLPPFFTHASHFPPQEEQRVCCSYLFFNPEELLAPCFPDGLPEEFGWYRYADYPKLYSGASFPEEAELLRQIIRERSEMREGARQASAGLIETLLARLCRQQDKKGPELSHWNLRARLFPAIAYMDREYLQEADSAFLAHLCGLSRAQFLEYFRSGFGQTPRQYLRVARVRRACHALTSTENSILSIALETGFQSLSSFNRAFREIMGRSPQTFRNEKREIPKSAPHYLPYLAEVRK